MSNDLTTRIVAACETLIEEAESNADFDQNTDGTVRGWATVNWGYVQDLMEAVQVYKIKSRGE